MKIKRIYNISLTLLFIAVFLVCPFFNLNQHNNLFAQTSLNLESSAKALAVIDQNTNRLLLSKNSDLQLPMASTTKIMTAIVAIENCKNLDERFIVNNLAIGTPGSSMYLKEGEEVSIKELLYGLMLVSGNDAANAIALQIGSGSLDSFVELMNNKAKEIKCVNTHFDNPHGLDSVTHYTTAYDLAKITSYAMKNEDFKKIVQTKTIKIGERFLKNKQKLLFLNNNCTGVKTGFTDNALRCSVSSFNTENLNLICVVLNCPDMFEESLRLVSIANNNFKNYEILKPYTALECVNINKGKANKTWAVNFKGLVYPLSQDEKNAINVEINCIPTIDAPIKNSQILGNVKVYLNKHLIFEENLYTMEEVEKENVLDKANKIIQELF